MADITTQQIMEQARTWLGTKYHHQGRLKKSERGGGGVDCLGLVIGVIDELGMQDGAGNPLVHADEFNYSMYPEQGRLVRSISKHLREVPIERMRVGDVLAVSYLQRPTACGVADGLSRRWPWIDSL
jgi:cell wall-associated NlpC family hydrolase